MNWLPKGQMDQSALAGVGVIWDQYDCTKTIPKEWRYSNVLRKPYSSLGSDIA